MSVPLSGARPAAQGCPAARCPSLCPVSVPPRSGLVAAASGLRTGSRCPAPPAPERERSQAAGRAPPAAAGNPQLIFHPASRSPTRVTPNACHTRWRHGLTAPGRPHSLSPGSCSRLLPQWLKLSDAQPAQRCSGLRRDGNPATHLRCQKPQVVSAPAWIRAAATCKPRVLLPLVNTPGHPWCPHPERAQ